MLFYAYVEIHQIRGPVFDNNHSCPLPLIFPNRGTLKYIEILFRRVIPQDLFCFGTMFAPLTLQMISILSFPSLVWPNVATELKQFSEMQFEIFDKAGITVFYTYSKVYPVFQDKE